MDFLFCTGLGTLVVFLRLFLLKTEAATSLYFVDNYKHEFFRPQSSPTAIQEDSVTNYEVGAAISILLGLAPYPLSASSSSKLDEIFVPNPFNRPQTVFMMEVQGFKISDLPEGSESALWSRTFIPKITPGSHKADIELPEDEAALISLDEHLGRRMNWGDRDISEFASWLGGSYVTGGSGELRGELSIPLSSRDHLKLYMSKKEDLEFLERLLILIQNARRVSVADMSRSFHGRAQLIKGKFSFNKDFQQGNLPGLSLKRKELFFLVLAKLFDSFHDAYKGRIVGVLYFDDNTSLEMKEHLKVVLTPSSRPRQMMEAADSSNSTASAEVKLVRRTLAWLTSVILLIATLLGIYFLLNMPVARDTLLYSNAKID